MTANSPELQLDSDSSVLPAAFEQWLDLFFGEATPAVARVYASLRLTAEEQIASTEFTLTGRLIGPECAFAHTLPLRLSFRELDRRPSADVVIAESVVPDPCFWTPELPFWYRAEMHVRRGGEAVLNYVGQLGIRRLGVRDRFLHFDGKRFVLRGQALKLDPSDLRLQLEKNATFARESWTAAIVSNPSNAVCEFASRQGILVVADLTHSTCLNSPTELTPQLRRLAQWPAVGIVLLSSACELPDDIRAVIPNLLLAQHLGIDEPAELRSWAQLVFAELRNAADFAHKTVNIELPIVAVRRLTETTTIERAREGCDSLQNDLAVIGDFAGYVV